MLEAEAKTKICPLMTDGSIGINGPVYCKGSNCMCWDVWFEPLAGESKVKYPQPLPGYQPYDPPQGDCGMKPPELNFPSE